MRKWIYVVLLSLLAATTSAQMTGAGPGMNTAQVYNGQFFGTSFKANPIVRGPITLATCYSGADCTTATTRSYFTLDSTSGPGSVWDSKGSNGTITATQNGANGLFNITVLDSWAMPATTTLDLGWMGGDEGFKLDSTRGLGYARIQGNSNNSLYLYSNSGLTRYSQLSMNTGNAMFSSADSDASGYVQVFAQSGNPSSGGVNVNASHDSTIGRWGFNYRGLQDWGGDANFRVVPVFPWPQVELIQPGSASVAAQVTITVDDDDTSVNTGTFKICGFTSNNRVDVVCESVAITGAGAFTSANSYFSTLQFAGFFGVSVLSGDETFILNGGTEYVLVNEPTSYSYMTAAGSYPLNGLSAGAGFHDVLCLYSGGCNLSLPEINTLFNYQDHEGSPKFQLRVSDTSVGTVQIVPGARASFTGATFPIYITGDPGTSLVAAGDIFEVKNGATTETYTASAAPAADKDFLVGATDYETFLHLACAIADDSTSCTEGADYIAAAASTLVRLATYRVRVGATDGEWVVYASSVGTTGNSTHFYWQRGVNMWVYGDSYLYGGTDAAASASFPSGVDFGPADVLSFVWNDETSQYEELDSRHISTPSYTSSIVFEGATADAYETTLAVTDPTASDKTITLPNASGTVLLGGISNIVTTGTSIAGNNTSPITVSLSNTDSNGNSDGVTSVSSSITVSVSPSTSGVSFMGSQNSQSQVGGFYQNYDPDLAVSFSGFKGGWFELFDQRYKWLVQGGYTLDGTPTVADGITPDEVDITLVDPTVGNITDGKVLVCGYVSTDAKTRMKKTCETLDISDGDEVLTTVGTYIEIANIKVYTVTGVIADETFAADWDADAVDIVTVLALIDHPKSDFTDAGAGDPLVPASNMITMTCLDPEGCDVEFAGANSVSYEFIIVGATGTNPITFTTGGSMYLNTAGAFTVDDNDVLKLLNVPQNTVVVEVSRSNN